MDLLSSSLAQPSSAQLSSATAPVDSLCSLPLNPLSSLPRVHVRVLSLSLRRTHPPKRSLKLRPHILPSSGQFAFGTPFHKAHDLVFNSTSLDEALPFASFAVLLLNRPCFELPQGSQQGHKPSQFCPSLTQVCRSFSKHLSHARRFSDALPHCVQAHLAVSGDTST